MAIVEQGFIVGGGPEIESGKAHNYFSHKPLEDIKYKSGVRAGAKHELIVDTEIAIYFGALFFRTVSDGILAVDPGCDHGRDDLERRPSGAHPPGQRYGRGFT